MESLCRLCSAEAPSLKSIYSFAKGRLIADLITILIPIKFEAGDDLPKNICGDCLDIVHTCQELREKAVRSDYGLRSKSFPARTQETDQNPMVFVKMEEAADFSDFDASNILNHEETSNDSGEQFVRLIPKSKKLKKKKAKPLKPHSSGMTTNKRRLETSTNEYDALVKFPRLDEDSDDGDLLQLEMEIKNQNAMVMQKLATMTNRTQRAPLQDPFDTNPNFIAPSPISNVEGLNNFEEILKVNKLEPNPAITEKINNMVSYYAYHISNNDPRTGLIRGLVKSFMNLYFDEEFLLTLGWSNFANRIPFNCLTGHIEFMIDIVNTHTPGTVNNKKEALNTLYTFFKRLHCNKPRKLSIQPVEDNFTL